MLSRVISKRTNQRSRFCLCFPFYWEFGGKIIRLFYFLNLAWNLPSSWWETCVSKEASIDASVDVESCLTWTTSAWCIWGATKLCTTWSSALGLEEGTYRFSGFKYLFVTFVCSLFSGDCWVLVKKSFLIWANIVLLLAWSSGWSGGEKFCLLFILIRNIWTTLSASLAILEPLQKEKRVVNRVLYWKIQIIRCKYSWVPNNRGSQIIVYVGKS